MLVKSVLKIPTESERVENLNSPLRGLELWVKIVVKSSKEIKRKSVVMISKEEYKHGYLSLNRRYRKLTAKTEIRKRLAKTMLEVGVTACWCIMLSIVWLDENTTSWQESESVAKVDMHAEKVSEIVCNENQRQRNRKIEDESRKDSRIMIKFFYCCDLLDYESLFLIFLTVSY